MASRGSDVAKISLGPSRAAPFAGAILELLCRTALAVVFLTAGLLKATSIDAVTADMAFLDLPSPRILAVGLPAAEVLRIPAKSSMCSGPSCPAVPDETDHPFRRSRPALGHV